MTRRKQTSTLSGIRLSRECHARLAPKRVKSEKKSLFIQPTKNALTCDKSGRKSKLFSSAGDGAKHALRGDCSRTFCDSLWRIFAIKEEIKKSGSRD